jgi:very-short-patch-repair endonuclease
MAYETNLYSLVDIRNIYNIDFKSTMFLLDYYKIRKRGSSESAIKISKHKLIKTCNERYGVDNPSQVEKFKEKRNNTCIERFGVENIRKSKNFYIYIKQVVEDRYKMSYSELQSKISKEHWAKLTDEQKNEWLLKSIHSHFQRTVTTSKLETKIQNVLNELNLTYTTQFYIKGRKRCFYDFLINDYKVIIEVNGDYWHATPTKYKATDLIHYYNGYTYAKDVWKKDLDKKLYAEENGYDLIYIWENEINAANDIKKLLIEKLKYYENS